MSLSQGQENDLRSADGTLVRQSLPAVIQDAQNNSWAFLTSNQYRTNPVQVVRTQKGTRKKTSTIDVAQLTQFAGAALVVHVFDGWSVLGRAVDALSRGDWHVAIHLGYYAELRAAASLLASEGVLVLDQPCVSFNGTTHVEYPEHTHQFVWQALDVLAKQSTRFQFILKGIRVGQSTLSDWLSAAGFSTNVQSLALGEWLRAWSIEIQEMAKDRNLRNQTSYDPTRFDPTLGRTWSNCIDPILQSWQNSAPFEKGYLPLIDDYLLRGALEVSWKIASGGTPPLAYYVQNATGQLGETSRESVLLRQDSPTDSYLLDNARQSADERNPTPVLSRAFLLLRLATANLNGVFKDAQVQLPSLESWLSDYGSDFAIWPRGNNNVDYIDLWEDVDSSVQDLILWRSGQANEPELNLIWSSLGGMFTPLVQHQRIALWALA